jgi:hypothetical protein
MASGTKYVHVCADILRGRQQLDQLDPVILHQSKLRRPSAPQLRSRLHSPYYINTVRRYDGSSVQVQSVGPTRGLRAHIIG